MLAIMQGGGDCRSARSALIVNHAPQHVRNTMPVIGCTLSAVKIERRGAL
jgi:hypothetical protein